MNEQELLAEKAKIELKLQVLQNKNNFFIGQVVKTRDWGLQVYDSLDHYPEDPNKQPSITLFDLLPSIAPRDAIGWCIDSYGWVRLFSEEPRWDEATKNWDGDEVYIEDDSGLGLNIQHPSWDADEQEFTDNFDFKTSWRLFPWLIDNEEV